MISGGIISTVEGSCPDIAGGTGFGGDGGPAGAKYLNPKVTISVQPGVTPVGMTSFHSDQSNDAGSSAFVLIRQAFMMLGRTLRLSYRPLGRYC